MKLAALLIMLPLVAACDVHAKKPADGDENVSINAGESGQMSFNLPFANGQAKLPEGTMNNAKFDIDGVKLMPGATMTGFNLNAGDKGATVNFSFKAPASADAVRAYFVDEFKKQGVEAAASGTSVTGKSKDGNAFVIDVQPVAQGSTGTIAIQSKD